MITNPAQIDSWLDRYQSRGSTLSNERIRRSLERYYEAVENADDLSKSVKRRKRRINKLLSIQEERRANMPLIMNGIPEVEINSDNLDRWKQEPDVLCSKLDASHQFGEMSYDSILSEINEGDNIKCSIVIEDRKGDKYMVPVFLTQGYKDGEIYLCLRTLQYATISKVDIGKYAFLNTYPSGKMAK